MEAFANGGLLGRGPGEGRVKNVLPDAHADFVFAVAGEEFGMVICLVILGLFAFVVVRGLMRLLAENDLFVMLAGTGLLTQFGLQAFINMASTLHLIPHQGDDAALRSPMAGPPSSPSRSGWGCCGADAAAVWVRARPGEGADGPADSPALAAGSCGEGPRPCVRYRHRAGGAPAGTCSGRGAGGRAACAAASAWVLDDRCASSAYDSAAFANAEREFVLLGLRGLSTGAGCAARVKGAMCADGGHVRGARHLHRRAATRPRLWGCRTAMPPSRRWPRRG